MPWQPKFKKHSPECTAIAQQFEDCLNEKGKTFARLFGAYCHELHRNMNECFNKERIQRRKEHSEKGRQLHQKILKRNAEYQEFLKEMKSKKEQDPASSKPE